MQTVDYYQAQCFITPCYATCDVLTIFDEFDWASEVENANELQKCSPAISVIV